MKIVKFCTKAIIAAAILVVALTSCKRSGWSDAERKIINEPNKTMRVLTVSDRKDSLFLRKKCAPLDMKQLKSYEYSILAEKMIATVTSPEQDGVGIAGPQVGLSRRIVAVQRFDKEGAPFEVYPNIRIISFNGDKKVGREGCLSIPGRSGNVSRYQDISITYTSIKTYSDTTEQIKGFTAVIFQHECDHLDGILYTDLIDE